MRSFDVAYRFRLLPTPSNIPPIRAHAVVVVAVIVVVDVAGRRNAKRYNAQPIFLFALFRSPSTRHIFHVGHHFAPILGRSTA